MSKNNIVWDNDALKKLENIPVFVRPMAKSKIEKAALEAGLSAVTVEFMDQAKAKLMS